MKYLSAASCERGSDVLVMFIVTWDHHGVWLIEAVINLSSFGKETMEMLI